MKIYTEETLVTALAEISERQWIPSHKDTSSGRNDGAAGNLLEQLLGIEENNLPLANTGEWGLKVHRSSSQALLTLFHKEPSPTACKFVPSLLLPFYGWRHQRAGDKYPPSERSFRQTIDAASPTDRGFKAVIEPERVAVSFDSTAVSDRHGDWLAGVESGVGLGELDPQPYWGREDLTHSLGERLRKCCYVTAEVRKVDGQEEFWFRRVEMLQGISFGGFIECLRRGDAKIDFDARTGHNHGTKLRIKQNLLPKLYNVHDVAVDL